MEKKEILVETEHQIIDTGVNTNELDILSEYISNEAQRIMNDPNSYPYIKNAAEKIFILNSISGEKLKQIKDRTMPMLKNIEKLNSYEKQNYESRTCSVSDISYQQNGAACTN